MMKRFSETSTYKIYFSIITLCFSSLSFAQNESEAYSPHQKWLFNISVESISIDEQAAWEQGVDDSALALLIDGEYFFQHNWSTKIGLGFLSYDDHRSFNQVTEEVFTGDRDTESSDANAIPIYADIGYKKFTHNQTPFFYSLRSGVSALLVSERGISNCSNCYSEDIDINGGLYFAVAAGFKFNTWGLGLTYKHYASGDLDSAAGLEATFAY